MFEMFSQLRHWKYTNKQHVQFAIPWHYQAPRPQNPAPSRKFHVEAKLQVQNAQFRAREAEHQDLRPYSKIINILIRSCVPSFLGLLGPDHMQSGGFLPVSPTIFFCFVCVLLLLFFSRGPLFRLFSATSFPAGPEYGVSLGDLCGRIRGESGENHKKSGRNRGETG